ncbi:MAG: hypothetical protein JXA38_04165 [Methanosarcinaceae archaeon]|nr:hypothetical protein [Methanosarcinaceae archaeon]
MKETNEEMEILIDLDRMPDHIGVKREGFGRNRVYCIEDVEEIIAWILDKIPEEYTEIPVSVLIVGKMPAWMAMAIQHLLDQCEQVVKESTIALSASIYQRVCQRILSSMMT